MEPLEACRRNVGHISLSALHLDPCLWTTSPWNLTCSVVLHM
jgi:hypothetical protein